MASLILGEVQGKDVMGSKAQQCHFRLFLLLLLLLVIVELLLFIIELFVSIRQTHVLASRRLGGEVDDLSSCFLVHRVSNGAL
jgi:hypothetical protein